MFTDHRHLGRYHHEVSDIQSALETVTEEFTFIRGTAEPFSEPWAPVAKTTRPPQGWSLPETLISVKSPCDTQQVFIFNSISKEVSWKPHACVSPTVVLPFCCGWTIAVISYVPRLSLPDPPLHIPPSWSVSQEIWSYPVPLDSLPYLVGLPVWGWLDVSTWHMRAPMVLPTLPVSLSTDLPHVCAAGTCQWLTIQKHQNTFPKHLIPFYASNILQVYRKYLSIMKTNLHVSSW